MIRKLNAGASPMFHMQSFRKVMLLYEKERLKQKRYKASKKKAYHPVCKVYPSLAIDVHRIMAAVFVLLTFISIAFEIGRAVRKKTQKLSWFIFGRSGYQLFTFLTALILIITGTVIWICSELDIKIAAIALMFHEYVSYLTLASVIWHIYKKSHALITGRTKSKQAGLGAR